MTTSTSQPRYTLLFLIFSFLFISSLIPASFAHVPLLPRKWEATNFCKCICFGNYTILHLTHVDHPDKPCLSCTKEWCLNQNLAKCAGATLGDIDLDTGTGKEGDVEAKCFQRDSPRDQLIVTLFLLTVFGLLLGVGIKEKMGHAGFERLDPIGASSSFNRIWDAVRPSRYRR